MAVFVAWAALAGMGVVAGGCAEEPAPPPARKPPLDVVGAPTEAPVWCPGGLLCEAEAPLAGWRVPVACGHRDARRRVAVCRLPGVPRARLTEFFDSRYGAGAIEGASLVWRRPGTVAATGGPQPAPATLRAVPDAAGWRVVATPSAALR